MSPDTEWAKGAQLLFSMLVELVVLLFLLGYTYVSRGALV